MATQDADGLELARALDSLTDALSRAVRHAQQQGSAFQMAPVELVLRVTVSWAEPEAGGAEWRVLGSGAAAPPGAATAHSLTMRFTPREARRDSAGPAGGAGRAAQSPGGPLPSPRTSGYSASSTSAVAARTGGQYRPGQGGGRAGQLPGGPLTPRTSGYRASRAPAHAPRPGMRSAGPPPATADSGTDPISPRYSLAERWFGAGRAGGSNPPAPHGGPYAVRVSFYLDETAGEPPTLLVERAAAPVPEHEAAAATPAADQPDAGPKGRERLVDAIAEYVADRVDSAAFKPVKQQWEIRGNWNPAEASDQLDGLQKWLLHLVQQPQEDAAARLGLPPAAAEAAGGIGANIVIAPVNRAVEGLTKIVDVVGIVGGAALGLHAIALLCLKHLAHTEFHDMVVKTVTKAFDGLAVGTKEVPAPSAGGPAHHPYPSPRPPRPAPDDPPNPQRLARDRPAPRPASPAQRPHIPLPPPPPRPAQGPPPSAPPSPTPGRSRAPRIGGPGGF
jgi:hypothetical protein